jgi:hypothetical protein
MTVLQLRHENVSKFVLCASDLLLIIARQQSGQCRMGGRSGAGIGATLGGYLLGSRVCRSAQYNVAAKMPKAAAISAATIISVGIDVLPSFREHDAGKSDGDFGPDQIWGG